MLWLEQITEVILIKVDGNQETAYTITSKFLVLFCFSTMNFLNNSAVALW